MSDLKMKQRISSLARQTRHSISSLLAIGSVCLASLCLTSSATAQEPEIVQELTKAGAEIQVYKSTTNSEGEKVDLNMYIFKPEDHKATDERPAIVFFFGGGWNSGKPSQFKKHCEYLADRGIVAMTADYRVFKRHGTRAIACVSDAKSAVRWIRENASQLGVDPDRVAAGGGSAGGHVAACTGVITTNDEPDENLEISSVPNAMILFNPALILAQVEGKPKGDEKKMKQLQNRIGAEPVTVSPFHHVVKDLPPTIIFHGKTDQTVPYWSAEAFASKMQAAGNRCELFGYEKQGHGFFNFDRKNGKSKETVAEMDKFLVSLGFLAKQKKAEAKKNDQTTQKTTESKP